MLSREEINNLARRAMAPNREAYAQLYREVAPRMIRLSKKRARSFQDVEDAVANAFTALWTSICSEKEEKIYDPERDFLAWFGFVTWYKLVSIHRERQHARTFTAIGVGVVGYVDERKLGVDSFEGDSLESESDVVGGTATLTGRTAPEVKTTITSAEGPASGTDRYYLWVRDRFSADHGGLRIEWRKYGRSSDLTDGITLATADPTDRIMLTEWLPRIQGCWNSLSAEDQLWVKRRFPKAVDDVPGQLWQALLEPTLEAIKTMLGKEPLNLNGAEKKKCWAAADRLLQCLIDDS